MKIKNSVLIIAAFVIISCQTSDSNTKQTISTEIESATNNSVKYAKGFSIVEADGYQIITLKNPWVGASKTYQYVLYKNEKPIGVDADFFIKTPIKTIACMSLTHVSFIEKLNKTNSIIALSGVSYVSSKAINKRIKSGAIKEMGQGQSLNYELLVDNAPDFIMGYGIDASSNNYIDKLQTLGLKFILNSEYMENHPLGMAEWIKFVAAFYDESVMADSIFNNIENEYLHLLQLTQKVENKPTVFTGMPWNGAWYVPGAKSFQAQLLKDAGANYLWANGNTEKGSLTKAKEIIIDEAYDADFWINQNSYNSIASIVAYDEKFSGFNAIKEQQLFNNNLRLNSTGGNEYWENGVVQPQIVLKDLIKIFHPQLINHQLYYYQQLK